MSLAQVPTHDVWQGHHHHLRQNSVCSDEQASTYSLPEPVESAVKFLERVRHNSTHDKFSPKPLRRRLTSDDRSISANSSSCNFPVKTHRRASSLSRDIEGGVSVGGGAGAVGVTSMWIPVTSSDRRRYRPTSPTPSQSSFCSLPSSSSSVSTSGLWTGNATKISLAKKVFLHHQLLPNKTEGRRKERTTDWLKQPPTASETGRTFCCMALVSTSLHLFHLLHGMNFFVVVPGSGWHSGDNQEARGREKRG